MNSKERRGDIQTKDGTTEQTSANTGHTRQLYIPHRSWLRQTDVPPASKARNELRICDTN